MLMRGSVRRNGRERSLNVRVIAWRVQMGLMMTCPGMILMTNPIRVMRCWTHKTHRMRKTQLRHMTSKEKRTIIRYLCLVRVLETQIM